MLLYLIHYKKKNKYQYNIEQVQGELKNYMKTLIMDTITDEEILKNILELIEVKQIVNIRQLTQYLINLHKVDILRRYGYIITKMLQ